jgi:hypothetical protein
MDAADKTLVLIILIISLSFTSCTVGVHWADAYKAAHSENRP